MHHDDDGAGEIVDQVGGNRPKRDGCSQGFWVSDIRKYFTDYSKPREETKQDFISS
jgi:hypothetical protein